MGTQTDILVLCILRSGGVYTPEYVERLKEGVEKHIGGRFACLDDQGIGFPLKHHWPGWWSKIEAFRFTGKVLYIDLDTIIQGPFDVSHLGGFVMLQDFLYPKSPTPYGSGLMFWDGDYSYLYERFRQDPELYMGQYRKGGDQRYIYENLGFMPQTFQELLPNKVVSRKVHKNRENASVVCYHGRPKPHQTGWAA